MSDDQRPGERVPVEPLRPVDGGPVYCRNCQGALAPEDSFCPKCGTARAAVAAALTDTQVVAPVTEVVAPVLRERVSEVQRAPLMSDEPRSSGWLIALAVLAALFLAAVLYFALRPDDGSSPDTTTTTAVTAVVPVAPPPIVPLPTTTVTVAPSTTAAAPTTTTAAPTTTSTSTTSTTTVP